MKRKKTLSIEESKTDSEVKVSQSPATTKMKKINKDFGDVLEIKKKMSKVNLYLSLLNKNFFETVAISEVETASEIENEINDFLISKAKSVFGTNESTNGFSANELSFLKLLSRKGTETKVTEPTVTTTVHEVKEQAPRAPVQNQLVQKTQNVKSNIIHKTVSIIGKDGDPVEVEVETEKLVLPPPSIKRHPPASFEQQLQRASADMAQMQRAFATTSGPLIVDSTDRSDF